MLPQAPHVPRKAQRGTPHPALSQLAWAQAKAVGAIPRRSLLVETHTVLRRQYEAHASHRVLLGQTLPYGHLDRTKNRNRRKRREPTQLCSIAEQSSREPVSELALWVVLLYEVKEAYEFVTMQPRHVFLAKTFTVFP